MTDDPNQYEVWQPWQPHEVAQLFSSLKIPWWIAGGWALDLFLGVQTREHFDIDVQILRRDQQAVRALLQQWDIQGCALHYPYDLEVTAPTLIDTLPFQTWEPDMLLGKGAYDIFCRPTTSDPWAFQLMGGDADGDQWLFRRDARVHRPLTTIGSVTPDGIPYMAPEIQLLYKAKAPRPQDEADFARTFPYLDQASREFLVQALALIYPGHRWLLEREGR